MFDLQPIFTLYPTHSQSKCQFIILISYSTVTDLTDKSDIHNLNRKQSISKTFTWFLTKKIGLIMVSLTVLMAFSNKKDALNYVTTDPGKKNWKNSSPTSIFIRHRHRYSRIFFQNQWDFCVKIMAQKMYQAYNWMNIDIMDLKLTWSYLWSVILKYSSWALIDKVLQFVFEFDRSMKFLTFNNFQFFDRVTLWSKLVSFPFSIIFPKWIPTKLKFEFEIIPRSSDRPLLVRSGSMSRNKSK